uniref:Macro domain-containing protein n=1 Tax=Macrostomum lignano TaxID=282301 RepID=A0A1I8GKE4_9PLAT
SDYVDVSLQLNSKALGSLAHRFFLRISHAKAGFCSRGLVLLDDRCLAVRVTSRVARAAAFTRWSQAEQFLASYFELKQSGGLEPDEAKLTEGPLRLGMARCDCTTEAGEHQLVYWRRLANGGCACGAATLPADRSGGFGAG